MAEEKRKAGQPPAAVSNSQPNPEPLKAEPETLSYLIKLQGLVGEQLIGFF